MSLPAATVAAEVLDPVAEVEVTAVRGGRRRVRLGVLGWVSLAVFALAAVLAAIGPGPHERAGDG